MKHSKLSTPAPHAGASVSQLALLVFIIALILYVVTLAPGLLWGGGDFATFQTRLYTGELRGDVFGHPLWVIIARPFVWLPIRDVAYRANLASAFFAAFALVFVFLSTHLLTRSNLAALLATGTLAVSHTFWTYAVMPKVYALNALLLSASVYFFLRWGHERRGAYLCIGAFIYGVSWLNHLVLATAALGFFGYVLFLVWRHRELWKQAITGGIFFFLGLAPYLWLASQASQHGSAVSAFLAGFLAMLTTPSLWLIGLGAGIVLLVYQFPLTVIAAFIGARELWVQSREDSILIALVALGDAAFLLGATDPRTGGDYVWNLHYYLQAYVVIALWIGLGFQKLARLKPSWQGTLAAIAIGLPVLTYALAPIIARPILANVPGFRELPGRDNVTYVLSPWKQNETGARTFGENILNACPSNAVLYADYSIWAIVNYLQVVEGKRADVMLVNITDGDAYKAMLQNRANGRELYLADVNRYYNVDEIKAYFEIIPAGAIYRLLPR